MHGTIIFYVKKLQNYIYNICVDTEYMTSSGKTILQRNDINNVRIKGRPEQKSIGREKYAKEIGK